MAPGRVTWFKTDMFEKEKLFQTLLHSECCKGTIELTAHAVATLRMFLPHVPLPRAIFS